MFINSYISADCEFKLEMFEFLVFIFLGLCVVLLIEQLKIQQKTGREGWWEWHAAKSPRPGLKPRAAAARTKPLHMGRPLYQLS